MTDRVRELEAQVAALRNQVQRVRGRAQAQYDNHPDETNSWILDCTKGVCDELDAALAPDAARELEADARAVAALAAELMDRFCNPCPVCGHRKETSRTRHGHADLCCYGNALERARARGWLEA